MTFKEIIDVMDQCSEQIAGAFGAESRKNVLASCLPGEKEFVNFDEVPDLSGITAVAYCFNLMCFVLYTQRDMVYCVRECSIKTRQGLNGYMRLAEMRAERENL